MSPRWPKISIITPSLNQASYIEETIQSVLDQNYPNLDYLVVDGGSTDGTLEILRRYDKYLRWTSQSDRGQAHAINKGMQLARGEILAFLNSDDYYETGALHKVGEFLADHPDVQWVTGECRNVDVMGREVRGLIRSYKDMWLRSPNYAVLLVLNYISQPATFWRRAALEKSGYFDESLHYTMDYEYWLRLGALYPLGVIHCNLACFRIHPDSKSGSTATRQFEEELLVAGRYCSGFLLWLHGIHGRSAAAIYKQLMKASP